MDTCNVCTTGPSKATTKANGVRHCQMRAKTNNNLHVCGPRKFQASASFQIQVCQKPNVTGF